MHLSTASDREEGVMHSVHIPRLVPFHGALTQYSSQGALKSFQLKYALAYTFAYT